MQHPICEATLDPIDKDKSGQGSAEIFRLEKSCKYALLIAFILLFALIWDPVVQRPVRGISDSGHVWLFSLVTLLPITAAIAFIIVTAFLLYAIKKRKHYSSCLNMSWVLFVFVPIGTFLGAYSLRVLKKPEVRMSFGCAVADPSDLDWELNIVSVLNFTFAVFHLIFLALLLHEIVSGWIVLSMPTALKVLCLAVSLLSLLLSFGSFFVGWATAKRRYYRMCRILSALNCIALPFGTVIGIYSILVVNRRLTQSS